MGYFGEELSGTALMADSLSIREQCNRSCGLLVWTLPTEKDLDAFSGYPKRDDLRQRLPPGTPNPFLHFP